jgi:hypothetical protein
MPATATDPNAPTVPITFRASESQVARLLAALPTFRKATGEGITVSGLIRKCVDLQLDEVVK